MTNDWHNALSSLLNSGELPEGNDVIPAEAPVEPKRPKLTVSIEKKGRAGKTATIVSGFAANDDIDAVASKLKSRLATGGSARGGEILIQGDRRTDVAALLRELGYKI